MIDNDVTLLKEKDVCKILGFSLSTLKNWRKREIGPPYFKIDNCIRYDREKLIKWIEQQPTNNERA